MTGGFPIFQLPIVALKEVISQIDLIDIIKLSLVSKKSYCITKTLYPKSIEFRIGMALRSASRIAVEIEFDEASLDTEDLEALGMTEMPEQHDFIRIQNYSIPVTKSDRDILRSYWTDPVEGIKVLTDYVTEFFDFKKIEILIVNDEHDSKKVRSIIDYLGEKSNKSIPICYFEIANGENDDDIYTYFLDNIEVTDTFDFYIEPTENFRYDISLNLDYFDTCGSHWITVDVLVKINCRYMNIVETKLDSQGYNRFLKHWQNGGSGQIGYFLLGSENDFEFEHIVEGIDAIERDGSLRRRFKGPYGQDFTISGGWDIKRNDGKVATLFSNGVSMITMVTWPDWNNNFYEI